jgi:hypothetical protein
MSDSIKKYYELLEEGVLENTSPNFKSTSSILKVLERVKDMESLQDFIEKARQVNENGRNLTPATVFEIAYEEVRVDQLCTPKN